MNHIVFQAYGSIDILNECLYALHTLAKYNVSCEVSIYTDNKDHFSSLAPTQNKITYYPLTKSTIEDWKGPYNFVHRLKIKLLQDFCKKIGPGNQVLYVDTDTTFRSSPEKIFELISQNKVLMHLNEGPIFSRSNPIFKKVVQAYHQYDEVKSHLPKGQSMCNAGVLGFQSDSDSMLDKVLEINDAIYPVFKKHIVEQMAFSIVFSKNNLEFADKEIFHYWQFKEFRSILKEFFSMTKHATNASQNISLIDPERLIVPKLAYIESKGLHRLWKKANGKWKMPEIEWNQLG